MGSKTERSRGSRTGKGDVLSKCAISGLIPLTSRLGVLESKLQLGVFLDSKQGVWALVFLHFSQWPGAPSPRGRDINPRHFLLQWPQGSFSEEPYRRAVCLKPEKQSGGSQSQLVGAEGI